MALLLCLVPAGAARALDGSLVNPGVVAEDWQVPETAIDTRAIPDIDPARDAPADKPLPVYRLTEDTYFLFGNIETVNQGNRGWNGNAGFVVTSAGVVAIDTLGTPKLGRRFIATIRSVTDKPIKYLIVTHNHPDHAYGAAAFQAIDGITVVAHAGTREYNNTTTMEESVAYRKDTLGEDMQGFEPVRADILVDGEVFSKERITLGDAVFDVYNSGAHHSFGDLVIHQVRQDVVWISDLAFNQRTTYMGDGDSAQILESQDWLMDNFADAELMVPGHGSAQTPPFPMVDKTHRYVTELRRQMREAVESGASLYDAVQNVELEEWQDTRLYDRNQRANANFVYREMEQEFFGGF